MHHQNQPKQSRVSRTSQCSGFFAVLPIIQNMMKVNFLVLCLMPKQLRFPLSFKQIFRNNRAFLYADMCVFKKL